MPQEYDDKTLADLEKQVDELTKQIDDVMKLGGGGGKGPKGDDNDMTAGGENHPQWKGKGGKKNHDHQVGAKGSGGSHLQGDDPPFKGGGYGKSRTDGDDDMDKRLGEAAELLGLDKAWLDKALVKASKKFNFDKGNDDDDDDDDDENGNGNGNGNGDDDDDSNPGKTKKFAPDVLGESVVIEGERIYKLEVGEATFNVLQKQAAKLDKAATDIAKAQDEAEMEKLKKRADDLYSHIPGKTEERAQMLKAMNSMPEQLRKNFEAVLTSAEKLAKAAFGSIGHSGATSEDMRKTRQGFETKVNEIAKRDNISQHAAMSKARQEDPDGFKAYQGNGN